VILAFYKGNKNPNNGYMCKREISRPDRVNMVEMYHLLASIVVISSVMNHRICLLFLVLLSPALYPYLKLICRMASIGVNCRKVKMPKTFIAAGQFSKEHPSQ